MTPRPETLARALLGFDRVSALIDKARARTRQPPEDEGSRDRLAAFMAAATDVEAIADRRVPRHRRARDAIEELRRLCKVSPDDLRRAYAERDAAERKAQDKAAEWLSTLPPRKPTIAPTVRDDQDPGVRRGRPRQQCLCLDASRTIEREKANRPCRSNPT